MTRITEEPVEDAPTATENWECPKCDGTHLTVTIGVPAYAPVLRIDDDGNINIGKITYDYVTEAGHVYYCAEPGCDFGSDEFRETPVWNELIDVDWNNREIPNSWEWYNSTKRKQLRNITTKGNALRFRCPECGGTLLLLEGRVWAYAPVLRIDGEYIYWGAVEFEYMDDDCWFVCPECTYELSLINGETVLDSGDYLFRWFQEQNLVQK